MNDQVVTRKGYLYLYTGWSSLQTPHLTSPRLTTSFTSFPASPSPFLTSLSTASPHHLPHLSNYEPCLLPHHLPHLTTNHVFCLTTCLI
ncbi:hypothetical protein Pmani_021684 [Petrolisthes manimaculis]|uniref:Uncharacterized protein n=1 Tax=Petrolisthes manimaculis TaxID=1843537 RepID=A0AAE1U580_9EUCA|nr:hypothetical protein Pmani_021684 [Petrolisthes manimaculis]